jgi:hypothetical protein
MCLTIFLPGCADTTALDDAETRWVAQKIRSYSFTYQAAGSRVQHRVVVERGVVTAAVPIPLSSGPALRGQDAAQFPTMELLFRRIRNGIARLSHADFDARFGFPRSAYFQSPESGRGFELLDFTR